MKTVKRILYGVILGVSIATATILAGNGVKAEALPTDISYIRRDSTGTIYLCYDGRLVKSIGGRVEIDAFEPTIQQYGTTFIRQDDTIHHDYILWWDTETYVYYAEK